MFNPFGDRHRPVGHQEEYALPSMTGERPVALRTQGRTLMQQVHKMEIRLVKKKLKGCKNMCGY
jgi:hypothetical protein